MDARRIEQVVRATFDGAPDMLEGEELCVREDVWEDCPSCESIFVGRGYAGC